MATSCGWWLEKLVLPAAVGVLTLLVATVLAYRFTERWQKARQRRELQFQEITRFSEKADRIRGGLGSLFPAIRSGIEQEEQLRQKQLEIVRDIQSLTTDRFRFTIFHKQVIYDNLVAMVESAKETLKVCQYPRSSEGDFDSAFARLSDHTDTVLKESHLVVGFLTQDEFEEFERIVERAVARWARPT